MAGADEMKKNKHKLKGPIKSVCSKCNHIERYDTLPKIIWMIVKEIAIVFGLMFILLLLLFGPTIFASIFMQFNTLTFASKHSVELRAIALNLTSYSGDDPFMFADQIAENIGHVRYSLPSLFNQIQDPLVTYQQGGDCKNSAMMFSGLMLNLGFRSQVWCNVDKKHCVSKIDGGKRYPGMYMVVDLAADASYVFNNSQNYWDDAEPVWMKSYFNLRPRVFMGGRNVTGRYVKGNHSLSYEEWTNRSRIGENGSKVS
jgi:hypothetical protein